jgi:hypothetical protein
VKSSLAQRADAEDLGTAFLLAAVVGFGSNASVELSRHVGFTPDSGRTLRRQRTDASCHQQKGVRMRVIVSGGQW